MTLHVFASPADPIVIADETEAHVDARERLLDRAFGQDRFAKTSERLREGRRPAEGLALVASAGERLVGTVRLWNVTLGPRRPGLLLGPIAVDESLRGAGLGGRLMRTALSRATLLGHQAVILVGDEPYYRRFGFARAGMERLWLPGPVEIERFLGLELAVGALDGAAGLVSPTGREVRRFVAPEIFGFDRMAA